MNPTIRIAGTVAAVGMAIGVASLIAYDHGRSDGNEDGNASAFFVDRTSLDVFGSEGAVRLRRDDATRRDRFDLYVGSPNQLRLVGSYDGTTGRLTIVQK